MLRQLSHTLIHLKLYNCEFNLMTLCDILCEFPLLESLELNMKLIIDTTIELTKEVLPKLSI